MFVNTKIQQLTTIEDVHYSKLFLKNSVMKEMLGEFVKRVRNDKKLSIANVRDNAKNKGKKISTSYINKIENEPGVNPSYPKIQALSVGLGVTEAEILALIKGSKPNIETVIDERIENLKLGWSDIPNENKDEAERVIALMEREWQRLKGK